MVIQARGVLSLQKNTKHLTVQSFIVNKLKDLCVDSNFVHLMVRRTGHDPTDNMHNITMWAHLALLPVATRHAKCKKTLPEVILQLILMFKKTAQQKELSLKTLISMKTKTTVKLSIFD